MLRGYTLYVTLQKTEGCEWLALKLCQQDILYIEYLTAVVQ
jgi:hypothetical protein